MDWMITINEAFEIVIKSAIKVETEEVPFLSSLNRIIAENVTADIEMPPFDKSAVDGYACRKADLLNELEVIEIIPAGKVPEKEIRKNQCAKIMTGAPVPKGAEAVIMVEDVEDLGDNKIKYLKKKIKNNICYKGEDLQKGEIVLKPGTLIKPQHIAILATAGCLMPVVYRKIKVAVISTGDELVEPEVKPGLSQIRNSNAYQLMAHVKSAGAEAKYIGIALDTEESTRNAISEAFLTADIVLITGGVSMGDFDYVPQILSELRVELKFKSIAVQPGRPTLFGTRGEQFIFGLPGNPVSSFVQFELLVRPLIYKMSDCDYQPLNFKMSMGVDYSRKRSDRLSVIPAKIEKDNVVLPMEYHGSAHINSLSGADGLFFIPIGQTVLKKGDSVDVRLI
jgi:molybdopterin molybdotransferase